MIIYIFSITWVWSFPEPFSLRMCFIKLFNVADVENLFIVVQVDVFLHQVSCAVTGFLAVILGEEELKCLDIYFFKPSSQLI